MVHMTTQMQYATIIDFMEQHGDFSKPAGVPRGRHYTQERWKELAALLNSDGTGDPRSEEKWRKVWSDWKNNIKKKAAKITSHSSGTGGGPALQLSLSDLEKRVMNLIGVQAAVGMPIQEAGFPQINEEPAAQEAVSLDAEEYIMRENIQGSLILVEEPTPGTSTQPAAEREHLSPSPPSCPPPNKKRKQDDVARLFYESDKSAKEYARERDRVNEGLERERLRQRDEELRIREYEFHERMRQRDAEIQLQAQWLEFMQECLNLMKTYFERR